MRNSSRRSFIKAAFTTAGAFTMTSAFGSEAFMPSGSKKINVIVGAHPWVYAAPLPNYDITPVLEKIFADMHYAGMAGVELMHHPLRKEAATLEIGELKEKYNLPVIGTSYGAPMWDRDKHSEILEDAELVITNLSRVGGSTLGTSVKDAPGMKTKAQLDAQAELLKKIISIGYKYGVVLNLHNHTYEVEDDMHDLKGTLARIPDVRLGPDLNWLVRGGVDPVDFIRKYGGQMVFMHLRDQYANGRWTEYLGQGTMDFAAIADALQEVNFSGHAIIELAHEKNFQTTQPIRESLKMSREFVRETMGF